ncbi:UDP-N-acetyl-D-mannosamine dehydrogenase [Phyllobacterium leguminum]|uniref:UDP-N-acetyl-D-mannosaminuronic acid dehydrogenase n=1 Tax=Phyllobacterium leguminum TaxID=314237 RepID=A0A318T0R3_9HYPH|nr:UDP-N-acetyl-D-mannosamine dehydrogenase [Phyllobacterium leguminum]PYE87302.1 UDP-N-acetyl-D-mannosaminuronic acid dehydrogenase [Phyllobacterium leguminum]
MTVENPLFKTVSVIGLGYIGLPTAATLATRGPEVIGVDIRQSVVDRLNEGKAHFSEPDLAMLLEAAVKTGKLHAVTEPQPADAFIIAVPTPFLDDKSADLSYVENATRALARVIKKGDIVILESTSPVGTTRKICDWIGEERPDLKLPLDGRAGDVNVAYCPERILPGRMVFELVENDRIIGGMSEACSQRAETLYKLFVRGALLRTTAATAELVKLIENAYRDVNIAFANELSVVCEKFGLNVWEAIALANRHPRVNILSPGAGVGGHCIAIDPWFLISAAPEETALMAAARHVNDSKPLHVLDRVRKQLDRFKQPKVACLGLAYKPDVDDLRESPALQITAALADEGFEVLVVEPHVDELPNGLAGRKNVIKCDLDDAIHQADVVVALVGHSSFKNVSRDVLLSRSVIDAVGLWQH